MNGVTESITIGPGPGYNESFFRSLKYIDFLVVIHEVMNVNAAKSKKRTKLRQLCLDRLYISENFTKNSLK